MGKDLEYSTAGESGRDDTVKVITFALSLIEKIGMDGLCRRKSWDVGELAEARYELEKVEVLGHVDVD